MSFFVVLCSHLAFISLLVHGQTGPSPAIQLQYHSKPLVAGASGPVTINFFIKEGFKIPKKPAPKIQIDSTPDFEIKGKLHFVDLEKSRDPEYFNGLKPLAIQITSANTIKPGKYSLAGKFVYFYCSEKDKYCSRAVESIQIPIEILAKK